MEKEKMFIPEELESRFDTLMKNTKISLDSLLEDQHLQQQRGPAFKEGLTKKPVKFDEEYKEKSDKD